MFTGYRYLLVISCIVIAYGYLCRAIGLYFFWESSYIGWSLLFLTGIVYLAYRLRKKERNSRKWPEILGVVILSFILLVQAVLFIVFSSHPSVKAAEDYIRKNDKIIADIGAIASFSISPEGGIESKSDSSGTRGAAEVHLIVKGAKKYLDVAVLVTKRAEEEWEVVDIK